MLSVNYWKALYKNVQEKKWLVFFVILTTVLCFGFTITNFSLGVDDPARNYYLFSENVGNMVQQGRLLHLLVNKITHCVQFIPFFTDFTGAVLFALSALLYGTFFQFISQKEISLLGISTFCCVYISSSIIAEKYIYQLDVIVTMLSFCCSALALMYAYCFVKEKKLSLFAKSVCLLMVAIASYESFVFLYICGVMAVFVWQIAINDAHTNFRGLLRDGLKYASILLAAMAVYYGMVYLVQIATGQVGQFERWTIWKDVDIGIWEKIRRVAISIKDSFVKAVRIRYLPILVFCLFSVIGGAASAWVAICKKNPWVLCCFAGLWIGNFLIHFCCGEFLARAAQTFCFFSGFVAWLMVEVLGSKGVLKSVLVAGVGLLVFVQSADMNRWFYTDYVRYKKEEFVIHTLATKLLQEYDVSKPVIFTHYPEDGYLNTELYPGSQVIGKSMLYWSATAFEDPQQPFTAEIFRMHGYDFILSPTQEQYYSAYEKSDGMPSWPKEGSIQEFDDFIVVNFGEE